MLAISTFLAIKAGIDLQQADKAMNEQSGGDQEYQAYCGLGNHQRVLQAMLSSSRGVTVRLPSRMADEGFTREVRQAGNTPNSSPVITEINVANPSTFPSTET